MSPRSRVLPLVLALAGGLPLAQADEPPVFYQQVAARHGVSAAVLYELALRHAGRSSRFSSAPTPWPWTVRLCRETQCATVYAKDRAAMAAVLDAGRAAGLTLYLGPAGLPWASRPDLSVRAATSPRVTLNEAARRLARAPRAPKTGGVIAASSGPVRSSPRAARWRALIDQVAREEGLDAQLVHAVVAVESSYNPTAVSPVGATGLMQLMPETAERFGLSRHRRTEPEPNLRAGVRYLKWLLATFDQDVALALAGYNAGEGAVQKYGNQIPPYKETQDYVRKVKRRLTAARGGEG